MDAFSPVYLKIVCLAVSRKHGGWCVAGIVLPDDGGPYWVRPVSERPRGTLLYTNLRSKNEVLHKLCDILEVPVKHYISNDCQTENVLIDKRYRQQKIGEYKRCLDSFSNQAGSLQLGSCHDCKGMNNRVLVNEANKLQSSLNLTEPTLMRIRISKISDKKTVRAWFLVQKAQCDLKATGAAAEGHFLTHPCGVEIIKSVRSI